jgi:thioredoxin reductase (NADPH)
MEKQNYDLVIVGAGPAGLTASIYASRYKIKHAVVGGLSGGTMAEAHKICNFPSEQNISGWELTQKMVANAVQLGAEIIASEVVKISGQYPVFQIVLANGDILSAKTILLATGTKRRQLNIDNEQQFLGKGLAYCATCDGPFFKDKIVGVVGGGNSAATAVLYLSAIAQKVYWFYLGNFPEAVEPSWLEEIAKQDNVQHRPGSNIKQLLGEDRLLGVGIANQEGQISQVPLDGLFVEIGSDPATGLLQSLGGQVNDRGYVVVGSDQTTSIQGVWAAGDATTGSNGLRQIVTACSEGAIAADSIFGFLQKNS